MDVRIKAFQEATDTFTYLARLDLAELKKMLGDERLVDGMQNGRLSLYLATPASVRCEIMYSLRLSFPVWNAVHTELSGTHYRTPLRVENKIRAEMEKE
jgi:hypothetical protein